MCHHCPNAKHLNRGSYDPSYPFHYQLHHNKTWTFLCCLHLTPNGPQIGALHWSQGCLQNWVKVFLLRMVREWKQRIMGERSPVSVTASPLKSSAKNLPWHTTYYFSSVLNIPHKYIIFQVLGKFKLTLKNTEYLTGLGCFWVNWVAWDDSWCWLVESIDS